MAFKLLLQTFLRRRHTVLLGYLALAGLSALDAPAQSPGKFIPTGSLSAPRFGHTATLLNDGRVLIAGGNGASAEIYDPANGTFSPTGSMTVAHHWHAATLLLDGRVLICGGYPGIPTAELYDPATGTFTRTGDMVNAQGGAIATLLNNGKVLLSGGGDGLGSVKPEIYDPNTGTFTSLNDGKALEFASKAARLYNGTVLIVGSYYTPPKGWLYDPITDRFRLVAFPGKTVESDFLMNHTATLLPNGKVLIAGGASQAYGEGAVEFAVLYDPSTETFQQTGSLLEHRASHTATLLPSGSVLITGGNDGQSGSLASAELYNPDTGSFTSTGMMTQGRESHTATLLHDGTVLIVGGVGINGPASTADLYVPFTNLTSQCGKYPTVDGFCRRIGILPWYAGIPGQWETDLELRAGSNAVRFGYVTSLAFTYDGIGHNLLLEDYRGSFSAESVDHLDLTGGSYSARILAGVDCYSQLSGCQTVPSLGSLVVTIDGSNAAALEGVQIRETHKVLGRDGSVVGQTDAPVIFGDQASNRWSAALIETPLSKQAQAGATITAFAVTNLSLGPQAVVVKVFDASGKLAASAKTPVLNGASSLGPPFDSAAAVGGVYAVTLSNLLGIDLASSPGSAEFHGSVTFEGEAGGKIAPLVIQGSWPPITSVPVTPE